MNDSNTATPQPGQGQVIKLKIGDDTLRRIPVDRMWNEQRGRFAHTRFFQHAASLLKDYHGHPVPPNRVEFVYTDSDGDDITINSAEELNDAWSAIKKTGQVYRLEARLQKGGRPHPPPPPHGHHHHPPHHHGHHQPPHHHGHHPPHHHPQPPPFDHRAMHDAAYPMLRVQLKSIIESLVTLLANMMSLVQRGVMATAHLISGEQAANSQGETRRSETDTSSGRTSTPSSSSRRCNHPILKGDKVDPNYIHTRHTCDGCESSPIYGIRYHATNRRDFDFCENCFKAYEGDEITFEAEQFTCDCRSFNRKKCGGRRRFIAPGLIKLAQKKVEAKEKERMDALNGTGKSTASTTVKDESKVSSEQELCQSKDVEDMLMFALTQASNVVEAISNDINKATQGADNTGPLEQLSNIVEAFMKDVSKASESTAESKTSTNTDNKTVEASTNTEPDVKVPSMEETTHEVGAVSSKSENTVEAKGDEWNFVDEDGELIGNGPNFSKAVGMLGSALLEEDLARSTTDASISATRETTSPTTGSSSISLAAFQRWKNEISQLRELGFTNDVTSVEALESLAAAHIGVDSDEPVTVQKAVEHILKQQGSD